MKNKKGKGMIIVLVVIILIGIIAAYYSFQSAAKIKPEIKSNESGNSNASVMNTDQNTTNTTNKTQTGPISIPLEKPSFID